ncbi:hypothetical protein COU62_02200 [Candidatus Pacearchaeota archaeon CG10_big_fil_rev_8_21_14_0_10_35_219]|nr:hypothetical protein [Candidatus Pacearchaeota archaeon]OIO41957.1 MAG: hypothetical protein AUJ63_04350 [Candidatus Pacearchaeota archaeon CG1_02_35_32]PIO07781.1 MAG: hypothetical protein COU62_02200 [Candidatus Pacearchaeota archaeon CG10_big_fil_rev_8_21_14_0_10_35_219]PIY81003.1 MAG: hypothetical protein COY79_04310 [Candidatus Pacearchaeota archaeon CG_4_10_14_0_8_um_filter_35_169]PIZ79872.1 MAG: hypothetical protein COY00_02615 [Candidatus Pacearchaeota archaeon CG_4_10_14_0_2_um_filt
MRIIFEVRDKNGKLIRLTTKQHLHIMKKHPYMHKYLEEVKETLQKPDKITSFSLNPDIYYFYKGYKHLEKSNKFVLVIAKYLNGEGYIISTYLEKNIR